MSTLSWQCEECKASFYTQKLLAMHNACYHREVPLLTEVPVTRKIRIVPAVGYEPSEFQKKASEIFRQSDDKFVMKHNERERLEKKFANLKVVTKLHKVTELYANDIEADETVLSVDKEWTVKEEQSDYEEQFEVNTDFTEDARKELNEDDVRILVVNDDGMYVTQDNLNYIVKEDNEETIPSDDEYIPEDAKDDEDSEGDSDQRATTVGSLMKNPGLIEMRHVRKKKIDGLRVMNVKSVLEFKCKHCDEVFPTKHERRLHLETHARDLRFFCSTCGRGFRKNQGLLLHLNVHTEGSHHQCPYCHNYYRTSRYLKEHIKLHMPEEYKFQCEVCSKAFAHRTAFKYHMRAHRGETPYICSLCGKGYRQKPSLEAHMNLHEGTRPYLCTDCGKGFRMKHTLRDHQRLHSNERPHICRHPGCGKAFRTSADIYKHKMIHDSKERLACTEPLCRRTFLRLAQLRKHQRQH